MRQNGIPDSHLIELNREWAAAQAYMIVGAGGIFWLPGGADTITRWQEESDAIWSRDLSTFRSEALLAEQNLHVALAPEPYVERKSRLDVFGQSTTPLDFSTLRDEWNMEARLVPIDRRIAGFAGGVVGEVHKAEQLGIRSDPAAGLIARSNDYSQLSAQQRMSRAEFLTRDLVAVQKNLQGRLDAATVTQQNMQRASDEISIAALYGLDLSGYQSRIGNDRIRYANALTVAEFSSITADLQQVAAAADQSIYVVMSQTHIVSGVAMIYQDHPLSCEEAATSMRRDVSAGGTRTRPSSAT